MFSGRSGVEVEDGESEVRGDDEVDETDVDIWSRSRRRVTMGRASSIEENAPKGEFDALESKMNSGGVRGIGGKLLCVARGLGTSSKRSSLVETSIEVKGTTDSSR
jgi:hypothetical protein